MTGGLNVRAVNSRLLLCRFFLLEAHEELLGVTSYLRAGSSPDVALDCPPILVVELEALDEELVLFLSPAAVLRVFELTTLGRLILVVEVVRGAYLASILFDNCWRVT